MIGIFIFIFGLIVGSFLNCVIWRMSKGESFIFGRSYCPKCKHDLNFFDLFPILSFLFLKGRCRYCKEKISYQYPLVEFFTGLLFLFLYLNLGIGVDLIFWLVLISLFIIIFVYDIKYYTIPDRLVFLLILLSIIRILYSFFAGLIYFNDVVLYFLSAIGASLFFFLIWFFSKGMAMGFGDVKLAFLIGLILGWPYIVIGLFLGFLFGAIVGTIMIILKKRQKDSEIPFAPFLLLGMFVAYFFGEIILNWYLSLI